MGFQCKTTAIYSKIMKRIGRSPMFNTGKHLCYQPSNVWHVKIHFVANKYRDFDKIKTSLVLLKVKHKSCGILQQKSFQYNSCKKLFGKNLCPGPSIKCLQVIK